MVFEFVEFYYFELLIVDCLWMLISPDKLIVDVGRKGKRLLTTFGIS